MATKGEDRTAVIESGAYGIKRLPIQLHGVHTEIDGVDRFSQVLSWQFETFPNAQKVVVDVAEDICLSTCVSTETLELVRTGCE